VHVADEVDAAIERRVLVHGSMPPSGRDLDVLARIPEMEALHHRLPQRGFVAKGNELARFDGGLVELVDLAPASWWQLPDDEIAAVFDEALPIEGYSHLVRPSPHHMLLILTRRLVEGKGFVDEKRRAYIERALADASDAWHGAAERAAVWGAVAGLAMLRTMYESGTRLGYGDRARAAAERLESTGLSGVAARKAAISEIRPRVTRTRVVSLSGMDGSGKSTQAEALAGALQMLGYDARAQWSKLGETPWIWRIARPAKKVLLWVTRSKSSSLPPPSPDRYGPDAGTELRRKSPALTRIWATVVAISNALTHRRVARGAGAIVVCDRYVLDSVVNLRVRYGVDEQFRFQARVIRMFSPTPVRSFLLRVPPEVAHERRREEHTLEELHELGSLYDAEAPRLDVEVVDASRTVDEITADLARATWVEL
jgi:thymidylate kinase